MDLVRDEVYGMQQLERALLVRREAVSRASTRTALVSTLIGLGLGLGLVATVITLVARNLEARQRTADVLHAERERFRTTLTSIGDAVWSPTRRDGSPSEPGGAGPHAAGAARRSASPWRTVFRIVDEATREHRGEPGEQGDPPGRHRGSRQPHRADRQGRHRAAHRRQRGPDPGRARPHRRGGPGLPRHHRAAASASDELAGRRDRRKDEFLAMLAHELRNPLAPIRNAACRS